MCVHYSFGSKFLPVPPVFDPVVMCMQVISRTTIEETDALSASLCLCSINPQSTDNIS